MYPSVRKYSKDANDDLAKLLKGDFTREGVVKSYYNSNAFGS